MKYLVLMISLIGCSPTVYNRGVPNLYQVDECVWRSGQPTTLAQWQTIKSLGITHVAKLNFSQEASDDLARSINLDVHDFAIEPRGDLDFIDSITHTFIHPDAQIVNSANEYINSFYPTCPNGKLLIHCTHGQDRTGFMVGLYRLLSYNWNKDQAYSEMIMYHFHPELHGLKDTWDDYEP